VTRHKLPLVFGGDMKSRRIVSALIIVFATASPGLAQTALLKLDNLDKLSVSAKQVVDVTVDEQLLQLASKFLSSTRSADEREIRELVKDLKGVYVKRFEFDTDGQYSSADIEPVLKQLRGSGWARIVGVTSKREFTNIEVFVMTEASIIKGIAVVAAEPRELTVVNVVGPIDVDRLSRLQGQFGIPSLELGDKPR
jgi:Zn-dependent alcohol dehydrogenase